jgi:hypothetical protein
LELSIRPTIPVESVKLQLGNDKNVQLTAGTDGWYRWNTKLEEGFPLSPILTESHGLTNRRVPKCQFIVYQDKPPTVKVLTPDDKLAVRPDDTIQITFTASDDVGIGTAELLVYDEASSVPGQDPVPIAAIPIPLGEQTGARSVQETVDLDLSKFTVEDGSELSYEIRVREDRGIMSGQASSQVASNQNQQTPAASNSLAVNQPSPNQPAGDPLATNSHAENQQSAVGGNSNPAAVTTSAGNQATAQSATNSGAASQTASASPQSTPGAGQTASSATQPNEPGSESASASSPRSDQTAASETPPSDLNLPQTTAPEGEKKPEDTNAIASNTPTTGNPRAANSATPSSGEQTPSADAQANTSANAQEPSANSAERANTDAEKLAGSEPSDASQQPSAASNQSNGTNNQTAGTSDTDRRTASGDQTARTASTGRQSLSGDRDQPNAQQPESMANPNDETQDRASNLANGSPRPEDSNPQANANSQQANNSPSGSQQSNQQAGSRQQSPSGSQANSSQQQQPSSSSDTPPGDSMQRRSLDIAAQSSSSNRMRLSVDQWAGSFEGQQRAKLEMAISPELEALDKALEKGQKTARGVMDELEANREWRGTHDRDVTAAERSTVDALNIVKKLQDRSKDTPYAFIGLQVADIGLAHIDPARANFWNALESEGGDRATSVRDGWQHLGRARELVAELRGQYERARREFQLAESVERVKKMYQVYLENSQALLETQDSDPTRFSRKMVEFDLDDEYLQRLQEVMEMRRDLRAELARILSEDPRLLRRFMDSLRFRSNNLREELAELVANQSDLNREVRAWALVEGEDRPRIAKILLLRQVQDAAKIATAAGELQSRYQTWLPLDRESKDAELAAATKNIQEMATAAEELNSTAQKFVADMQRVSVATPAGEGQNAAAEAAQAEESGTTIPQQPLDDMLADAQQLYDKLNKLEVALRQLAVRENDGDTAVFAGNRLVDARRLVADTSAWVRQIRAHKSGNYTGAAEVDQYRLAMKTDELAGKLGTIEQTLAGLMQRSDGSLPEPIAQKAREFITTLDKEASPNQLASVYALHNNQLPRATERQKAAGDALAKAEKTYDELIRLAIEELDKLPVQDPVADLLDDPTLDELLAQLEQEAPIEELLGIPQRPSNLRIIGDWMRPGGDNALQTGGGGGQMVMNQLQQNNQQTRQRLNRAYQRAIARALKETAPKTKIEVPKATRLSDWNQLVSKLGDDLRQGRDKAPPEQYRRAIEQYFAQISNVVAENEATPE